MPIDIFGFQIGRKQKEKKEEEKLKTFVTPTNDDGAITVTSGGAFGQHVDLSGGADTEFQLISKYREMALYPKVDSAVDDIVNSAIVMSENEDPVTIDFNIDKLPKFIKRNTLDKISEEFSQIIRLLDFNRKAYDIFRRWYIDGRLYYHVVLDEAEKDENGVITRKSKGIKKLEYIDPRQMRKVRVIEKVQDQNGIEVVKIVDEFYIYNSAGIQSNIPTHMLAAQAAKIEGIKIMPDSIIYIHSGIPNAQANGIISHLHFAIKPLNQLRMMEDALVIYRIARAPERRIFYIDVGNLSTAKAQTHMKQQMANLRNRITYDVNTGEARSDVRHLAMLEDYFIPRQEGSTASEIDTLRGGENLGEIQDVEFFRKNLYEALKVPVSRMDPDSGFILGRSTEISRDEVNFTKFIHRLRLDFGELFTQLLEKQLILKGIVSERDWDILKEDIFFNFTDDNYFTELKNSEILASRVANLVEIDPYVGKYFSEKWVKENVLHQSEEEQRQMAREIKREGSEEDYDERRDAELGLNGPDDNFGGSESPQNNKPDNPNNPQDVPLAVKKDSDDDKTDKKDKENDKEDK